jgi:hypothetical protein
MYKSWMWKQRSYREQFEAEGSSGAGGIAQTPAGDVNHGAEDADQGNPDDGAVDQPNGEPAGAGAPEDDGEVVVMLGDEPIPASNDDEIEGKPAPQWVRDLRKREREQSRRIRELEAAAAARESGATSTAPAAQALGPKPTPEDFDFDAEKYGEALIAWQDRKRDADAREAAARQEQEAAQASWTAKLTAYNTAKATLRVDDFDGAEHVVRETMNTTQQGVILSGAEKPELVIYALGRNPAMAKELAAIKDPIKFAFRVAKLETQLKVTQRKDAPPAPERQVRGNAGGGTSIDSTEARLEAEADASGNRTKLIAYRKQKKAQAAA